jgi:Holliday junction resolvase
MAATPESKVKKKVQAILKELGCYYFSPIGGPYSAKGVPDIITCYKSKFIGIECKSGNKKPTALQEKNLQAITDAGGLALVINESNVDLLKYKIDYHLENL